MVWRRCYDAHTVIALLRSQFVPRTAFHGMKRVHPGERTFQGDVVVRPLT